MQFQTFSLPHITGGTYENNRAQLVTLTLSVDIHTAYSADRDAAESVYADALTAGADTLSRKVFLDTLGKTGGSISVAIARSILTIALRVEASQATVAVKLLKAMLEAPTFAAAEIARIKKNLHNDLELEKENARGKTHTMLQNVLFGKDDRRQTAGVAALQKAVADVQKADLEALHSIVLREPWTVTISGTTKAIETIKKLLVHAKGKRAPEVASRLHAPKTLRTH
jgi:predicted Zn-dependent peptidase